MKKIYVVFEDSEMEDLKEFKDKNNLTWHALIMRVLDEREADQE